MALKRILGLFFIGLLLLFFLLIFALYFFLPGYLETNLIPKLAKTAGINSFSCQIRRIGFTGVDVAGVNVGKGLAVDSVQIDYRLRGLLKRHVQTISVTGADLHLTVKDGNISIDGIQFPEKKETNEPAEIKPVPAAFYQTVFVDRLSLKKSVIVCHWNGKTLRIPVEMDIVLADAKQIVYRYLMSSRLREGVVKMAGEVHGAGAQARIGLDCRNVRLERFSDIFSILDTYRIRCDTDIQAGAKVDLQSMKISDLSVSIMLNQPQVRMGDRMLRSASAEDVSSPVVIKIDSDDLTTCHVSVSNASAGLTWGDIWGNLEGMINLERDAVEIDGSVCARYQTSGKGRPDNSLVTPLVLNGALPIQLEFNGRKSKDTPWRIQAATRPKSGAEKERFWHGIWKGFDIQCLPPQCQFSASVGEEELSYQVDVNIPQLAIANGDTHLHWSSVTLFGEKKEPGNVGPDGILISALASEGRVLTETANGSIPKLTMAGMVSSTGDTLVADGEMSFSKGAVYFSKEDIRFKGISARVPFRWPFPEKQPPGYLRVASMNWGKRKLGSIRTDIFQSNGQVSFKGAYDSRLFKGMVVSLSGKTDLLSDDLNTQINLSLKSCQLGPDLALDQFVPAAGGALLSGKLTAQSNLTVSKYSQTGTLVAALKEGQLKDEAGKWSLGGISVNLAMPDLLQVKSAPRQMLSIESLSYGTLQAGNLEAAFQIESPQTIFIEQGRFKWCNGHLQTQPIRFQPGIDNYDVTLFCDRLALSCLLDQLGALNATGDGTVNGRIPIRISDRKISFEDGFLYSTPGAGGHIHMTRTELLTAGIPPDTPQYVQMDIAKEALKDYEYKWVKVNLATEKNNLNIKLQFDGKPGNLLPFVYKKELGRFIRIDAAGKGSRFQGISLDVNFNLPLDDLLQYKDIMEQLN